MKAKTIAKNIESKIDDWLLSITDTVLAKDLRPSIIVTGGCITSMFLQENVNDYDVYLSDKYLAYRLAAYYALKSGLGNITLMCTSSYGDQEKVRPDNHSPSDMERVEIYIPSAGVHKFEKKGDDKYQLAFLSSNAVTLTDKIQIILRFTGEPEEIHSNYDFAHATNYWTAKDGLVTNTKALECILSKELVYRGSKYPLSSIFRTRKFIQRGWRCHVANYLKMALQLNELDLTNPDVLKDQLTGVDSAYLSNLINSLNTHEDKLTAPYICKVIDRMLGESDSET